GILDLAPLSATTAADCFLRWWDEVKHAETVAVVWPTHLPSRYAGLFRFLANQPSVRSVPVSKLKSLCGGPVCTVADVIRTAREFCPQSEADSYERAAASLVAGLRPQGQ